MLGNMYDDRHVILTLIKLFTAPKQPVRLAVSTQLKHASNDSYDYSSDSTNRQESLKK